MPTLLERSLKHLEGYPDSVDHRNSREISATEQVVLVENLKAIRGFVKDKGRDIDYPKIPNSPKGHLKEYFVLHGEDNLIAGANVLDEPTLLYAYMYLNQESESGNIRFIEYVNPRISREPLFSFIKTDTDGDETFILEREPMSKMRKFEYKTILRMTDSFLKEIA